MLTADQFALTIAGLALASQLAAIVWTLRYRKTAAVLWINLIFAFAILAFNLLSGRRLWVSGPDIQILGLISFELLTAGAAYIALRGSRAATWISIACFAVHLVISAAALLFFATFRIDRLI